jgi:hypothetical protein
VWVVRRGDGQSLFSDGKDDQLPARGRLSADARALVESGAVELVTGFRINGVSRDGRRLRLQASDRSVEGIDEVVAATGFRPDFSPLRELRLSVDPVVESTPALAPLIDPHLHSCGTVPIHGAAELEHPEPDFYVVGAKSYGRAPTFLAKTGYEQVRSVITAIASDGEASPAVRVDLPDTGVRANGETSVVEDSVGRVAAAGDCGPAACDGSSVIPAVDRLCHRAVISEAPCCCG